jgi:hypothetical protein
MTVNSLHPSAIGRAATQARPPAGQADSPPPGIGSIDWRAARRASRACCCPARPAVLAVIPPAAGRPDPTDLLLCGHHYRASRRALASAGVMVLDMNGSLVLGEAWPQARADV